MQNPPKCKKKYSRNLWTGQNQEKMLFDFAAARESIGNTTANTHQVVSCVILPKSPPKWQEKTILKEEKAKNDALT